MIIKVNDEHNFFLFQDLVEYFILILNHKWSFPISNKYNNNKYPHYCASYYIYNSWYELFLSKLANAKHTEYGQFLMGKQTEWMVTTNIAILMAQEHTEKRRLDRWDYEYLEKHQPYFLIEHSDDYESYIVHLDGDIKTLFNEAVFFWKSFERVEANNIYQLLSRYFELDESLINELGIICENYDANEREQFKSSYEIVED